MLNKAETFSPSTRNQLKKIHNFSFNFIYVTLHSP